MAAEQGPRLILASASPARQQVLRQAGLHPDVVVSQVDESGFTAPDVISLVAVLAEAKATDVLAQVPDEDVLVVGCDSLLEFAGEPFGKPADLDQAKQRWLRMRGASGQLHTGHHVWYRHDGRIERASSVATTEVIFANLDEAEIDAYLATGEPLKVAGGFTIDGLGGAYVTTLCGDPHNVVGISLPLLRRLLSELGVPWHSLWRS
ncbi:septum formation protein [Propionicimonas paludicola]|uniref:Nucleoside triphosphate pyrophosphatase n=1 Tax=Propionicimonas paludicola TaxID=185243 RepID=A0A2A9CQG6_9ACTN|nr:Maf family protein [Propionicimonas paludicola]PFG15900.1 septum formation protein [Propionicimonas paludicola]